MAYLESRLVIEGDDQRDAFFADARRSMMSLRIVRYTYAQLEATVIASFGIPPYRRGVLIGIIKQISKFNLFSPMGKGRRRTYLIQDVVRVALAIKLYTLGVDAGNAARICKSPEISGGIDSALDSKRVWIHVSRGVTEKEFCFIVQESDIGTFDDSLCVNIARLSGRVVSEILNGAV